MTDDKGSAAELAFGPDVDHHRLGVGDGDVYVVGDVHGCRAAFERLLDGIAPAPEDCVVVVGDLVRKGPDSAGVLDLVAERAQIYSVRGNNEDKLLERSETLPELTTAHRRTMAQLPDVISWDGGLVVHGGVAPHRPLAEQGPEDVLTMRSPAGGGYDGPFWFESYRGPPRVFFGHTVLTAPLRSRWAVGLDTGCVYGGSLTAYDCSRDRFLSVAADRAHEQRPDEKFLDPASVDVGRPADVTPVATSDGTATTPDDAEEASDGTATTPDDAEEATEGPTEGAGQA